MLFSNTSMFARSRTRCASAICTACPVKSSTCTTRRWLWPPSRVRCNSPFSRLNFTPCVVSQSMEWGALVMMYLIASSSPSSAPATKVSRTWLSKLSSSSITAEMPPWAWSDEPLMSPPLEISAILYFGSNDRAQLMPAKPLPMMTTSNTLDIFCFLCNFNLSDYDHSAIFKART